QGNRANANARQPGCCYIGRLVSINYQGVIRFRRNLTFMASKAIYTVVAVVGIAAASGAAWWYQNKASVHGSEKAAVPAEGAQSGGTGGPSRPPAVEV